jgi:hypothetical protein
MATMKLKLGKGSSFVKSRLLRYPQEADVWEADFQPIPDKERGEFWLGMVVNQEICVDLAHQVLNVPPTVNDLARILAEAIQRPIIGGSRHRPSTILLRDDPQWEELLPHLRQLNIEVVKTNALPVWKEVAQGGGIERAMRSSGPPRVTEDTLLAAMFPAIAKWVRHGGWIEIGDQADCGFVVRAIDEGGLVFEDAEARTLDEGMTALERGIAEQIADEEIRLTEPNG